MAVNGLLKESVQSVWESYPILCIIFIQNCHGIIN